MLSRRLLISKVVEIFGEDIITLRLHDREYLKSKREMCIHSLEPAVHPKQIVNVANSTLGASQVNVNQAFSIGNSQLLEFEKELPNGFWISIERTIKTMATTTKGIAIGSKVVYDIELIFS